MKRTLLIAFLVPLLTIGKAQQNLSSETDPVPFPPPIMMKNGTAAGSNQDKMITELAAGYKSAENVHGSLDSILKDFNSWWTYTYQNIRLSRDFIGIAPDSTGLNKGTFLRLLTTGEFYPVKTDVENDVPCYRLFSLTTANKDIQNTVIQLAGNELLNYNMEGKELPAYRFEDLDGRIYDNANTKGKIIVVKCWFIRCGTCIKEFPELNTLVSTYKNRNDIVFLSLAFDNRDELTAFLKTHKLNYAVVPGQEQFMNDKLGIASYPTHIIVGKDGKIVRVVNNADDLAWALQKVVATDGWHGDLKQ